MDDDDDEDYGDIFESIQTPTGLEIGCIVQWPIATGTGALGAATPATVTANLSSSSRRNPVDNDVDPDPLDDSVTVEDGMRHSPKKNSVIRLELSTRLPPECIAPMFDGTQWAGTRVWRAAVVALQYLLFHNTNNSHNAPAEDKTEEMAVSSLSTLSQPPRITASTRVLELGCGLGIPGMILHAVTGCRTVLTDKDDLVVQLRQNLQSNHSSFIIDTATAAAGTSSTTGNDNVVDGNPQQQQQHPTVSSSSLSPMTPSAATTATARHLGIQAHALDWSVPDCVPDLLRRVRKYTNDQNNNNNLENHENNNNADDHEDDACMFDLVLNADCIYEPLYGRDCWKQLLVVQEQLLVLSVAPPTTTKRRGQERKNVIFMLTACERRRADGVDRYLDAARASPAISRVEQLHIPFECSRVIELYRLHAQPPQE